MPLTHFLFVCYRLFILANKDYHKNLPNFADIKVYIGRYDSVHIKLTFNCFVQEYDQRTYRTATDTIGCSHSLDTGRLIGYINF